MPDDAEDDARSFSSDEIRQIEELEQLVLNVDVTFLVGPLSDDGQLSAVGEIISATLSKLITRYGYPKLRAAIIVCDAGPRELRALAPISEHDGGAGEVGELTRSLSAGSGQVEEGSEVNALCHALTQCVGGALRWLPDSVRCVVHILGAPFPLPKAHINIAQILTKLALCRVEYVVVSLSDSEGLLSVVSRPISLRLQYPSLVICRVSRSFRSTMPLIWILHDPFPLRWQRR